VYFVTAVTHERAEILRDNADILWNSIVKIRNAEKFDLIAWAMMPDHFHMIIDCNASSLSKIMQRIKLSFAYQYRRRMAMYRGQVWQSRFWDHAIRDQKDMNRHIDYVHYNPVKHHIASSPFEWKHSSIHEYLENGYYSDDWGVRETLNMEGEFGE
jgi:putative transposase